jgi:hypothetical protein
VFQNHPDIIDRAGTRRPPVADRGVAGSWTGLAGAIREVAAGRCSVLIVGWAMMSGITKFLNWWDGVELWIAGLGFVAQTAIVMPVVIALAYGIAVVLDGALGNGIRLLRQTRDQEADDA